MTGFSEKALRRKNDAETVMDRVGFGALSDSGAVYAAFGIDPGAREHPQL